MDNTEKTNDFSTYIINKIKSYNETNKTNNTGDELEQEQYYENDKNEARNYFQEIVINQCLTKWLPPEYKMYIKRCNPVFDYRLEGLHISFVLYNGYNVKINQTIEIYKSSKDQSIYTIRFLNIFDSDIEYEIKLNSISALNYVAYVYITNVIHKLNKTIKCLLSDYEYFHNHDQYEHIIDELTIYRSKLIKQQIDSNSNIRPTICTKINI